MLAALFAMWFNVEHLVRFLQGPYIGEHQDILAMRNRLHSTINTDLLEHILHQFEYGVPSEVHTYSTDENFLAYQKYGNHDSCDKNKPEKRK